MIHTFTIKINTPDAITEQEVINKFCKANNYNPDFGDTKVQFFKKVVGQFVIESYRKSLKGDKDEIARTETETELQGITTE